MAMIAVNRLNCFIYVKGFKQERFPVMLDNWGVPFIFVGRHGSRRRIRMMGNGSFHFTYWGRRYYGRARITAGSKTNA